MQKAEFWIEKLNLSPHPEGGFYRETYRSGESYAFTETSLFKSPRSYATAIYYLLRDTGSPNSIRLILTNSGFSMPEIP